MAVQWRWPVGKPLGDGLGQGLYEVRTKFERGEYRVVFCVLRSTMVLLHGFSKKTRVAPQRELELARKRQREVEGEP
jgi:phage-related protein